MDLLPDTQTQTTTYKGSPNSVEFSCAGQLRSEVSCCLGGLTLTLIEKDDTSNLMREPVS